MPNIAIIDDRDADRGTLVRQVERELRDFDNWDVIESRPLPSIDDYAPWLTEHEVASLVLDERLHEDSAVGYEGSEVAQHLRQRFPTLPIYIITAYKGDHDLESRAGEVEDVISRSEFGTKPAPFVERFVRAGTKFYEENRAELERLAVLSGKAASGSANEEELSELRGLQAKLGLPYMEDVPARSRWLDQFEVTLKGLEEVERKLRDQLDNQS